MRWILFVFLTAVPLAESAQAMDISGTISTTLTIIENSRLVGDVTCTVTGAVCIAIGAPGITLDLNGYSITGQADPDKGCSGSQTAGEIGIDVNAQDGATIRGPGVVQRFRNQGIRILNSTGGTITGVTTSTNCMSGIQLTGGSGHVVEGNVSVRNGNLVSTCGGI